MMIKNLLYVLAIAISTMSYGQTTVYTISHSGSDNLVISSNGYFLNDDSVLGDGTGTLTETTVTITSTVTWNAGADPAEVEPTSFGTFWMPIKNAANDNIFAKTSGFKTNVDVVSDSGAGTSPRTITWEVTTLDVLDQTDADNKVAATLKSSGGDANVGDTNRWSPFAITIVDPYYPAGYIAISNEQTVFPSVTRGETFTLSFDYVANTTITGLRYRILLIHPANGAEDPYANATIGDVTHDDIVTTEGTLIEGTSTVTYTFPLDATINGINVGPTTDSGDGTHKLNGSDYYGLQKRNGSVWEFISYSLEFPVVNEAPVASVDGDAIEDLKVYPNPTSDIINISNLEGIETISIYNTLGKLVKTVNGKTSINISELPSGIYILITNNGLKRKIVKK